MHITFRLPPPHPTTPLAQAKAKDVNRGSTTVRGTYSKNYDLDSRKQQSQPVTFKNNTPDLITSTPLRYLASKPNFYWDSFIWVLRVLLYNRWKRQIAIQIHRYTSTRTSSVIHQHQQLIHCRHMR